MLILICLVRKYRKNEYPADVSAFIDGFQHALSFRAGLAFVSFVRKEIEGQFRRLPDIIRKADLVLGSSLMFGLASVAETQNIPYRYIAFTPHLDPALEQVPALDRFLEKGTRPVYAGFGSMPVKDQISIVPILIKAARNLGRPIILPRFHGLSTETTPGEDLFFIRDYPH